MYKTRLMLVSILLAVFVIPTAVPAGAEELTRWSLLNSRLEAVAEGGGVFVAVGKNGFILRSTNGSQWDRVASGVDKDLSGVAYGNGRFLAVDFYGGVITSLDGIDWNPGTPIGSGYFYTVRSYNGLFLAMGQTYGYIYTSVDGTSWNSIKTPSNLNLLDACVAGPSVIVTGSDGAIVGHLKPHPIPWLLLLND